MFKFDEEKHEYTLGDKILPSVTQILSETIFTNKYDNVSESTLKKAADKGSFIHKEIENYVKNGEKGLSDELDSFISIVKDNNLLPVSSEHMVTNNEIAGTIDLIFKKDNKLCLGDIKTTYELDKEYVSWQLSMYAYILECNNVEVDELYAIWLRGEEYKFVKVEKKSRKQVLEVLSCFQNGTKFELLPDKLQTILPREQKSLKRLLEKMEEAERKTKEIKDRIKEEMEQRGIYKIEIDNLVITLVPEHETTKFDSKKFKEDNEELYKKYEKTSITKSSLRTSFKK